ncbi:peptidyl-prolyl cis-trans isomerase CWC27 homolog [Limulus polyphemus]|uniref:Spliceosome-associated protein CWC27 homolog n=1 Tax=Limulus polyphemus TaxID=6850 RepID=A0ABM1BI17_LIMPO|nr:peptidyl-prolyl cis-trans isomerase CWC27 homolog [Limulus polyphemus]XP_013782413.1 peptidyl-prolyl cis-trans isomerase CWC27 homolog [Limulus polyphemus]
MSNIYIQEPPTNGKVLLQTTVGELDIELWSKEAPKACRNFVQLCLEGYYDGTIFHRLVKGFIVQGGDPTGTGTGGESIYGHPFKDEFHSRLRFVRRGLIAMANAGKDDNGSQFFFTLGACPELQNKHTIFGKITGDTLYNMLKLEESLVDQDERPLYPHKIIQSKVLLNPFLDILPRNKNKENKTFQEEAKTEKKTHSKATKNFSLLSFGEEAEEEEAEVDAVVKEYRGKGKSSHDLTNDPKLSSEPAVLAEDIKNNSHSEKKLPVDPETIQKIRDKLKKEPTENKQPELKKEPEENLSDREKKRKEAADKTEEIRKEIKKLKKEIASERKPKEGNTEEENNKAEKSEINVKEEEEESTLKEFQMEIAKYNELKKKLPKKGEGREEQTLNMLSKFQSVLQSAKENSPTEETLEDDGGDDDRGWLTHVFHFEDTGPVLAKDANIRSAESFEIFDPRNPLNQRRRESSKQRERRKP